MSLLSFLKQTRPIVLSLHDSVLQILQFEHRDKNINLVGFNEIALANGIMTDGNIADMEAFEAALAELFLQAKPNPIDGEKIYVNTPYELLYTFVEDFLSSTRESTLKESLITMVQKSSPIPFNELALDFASSRMGRKISYACYGSPVRWKKRLLKACKKVGVGSVEFIAEPICLKALLQQSIAGDMALFSNHEGRAFLSIFHNGLIYDCYFLTTLAANTVIDCTECFSAFKKVQEDFFNRFGSSLNALFFVGFDEIQKKSIEAHYEKGKNKLSFLDTEKAGDFSQLVPYQANRSTLFGLLHFLIQDEKPTGAVVPEEKALKFHQKSF